MSYKKPISELLNNSDPSKPEDLPFPFWGATNRTQRSEALGFGCTGVSFSPSTLARVPGYGPMYSVSYLPDGRTSAVTQAFAQYYGPSNKPGPWASMDVGNFKTEPGSISAPTFKQFLIELLGLGSKPVAISTRGPARQKVAPAEFQNLGPVKWTK